MQLPHGLEEKRSLHHRYRTIALPAPRLLKNLALIFRISLLAAFPTLCSRSQFGPADFR
jgi:hypothetical protein